MKIYATKTLYPPTAHCSYCDWYLTDIEPAKLRYRVRKHVTDTGHTAYVDFTTSSRYEPYPDAED